MSNIGQSIIQSLAKKEDRLILSIVKEFGAHGRQYGLDEYGVIHQLDAKPYTYDKDYVATYDTPDYTKANDRLQRIRMDFVICCFGETPLNILDVGYGNGAFLKAAKDIPYRYGKDVTGLQIEGVELVNEYIPCDVITFWDCLEHIPDLSFVRNLKCDVICLSLPWCHYDKWGQYWFDSYKHLKPDEHLHHFNPQSLSKLMLSIGWKCIATNNNEDEVRKSPGEWPNILTMAFKR